MMFAPVLWHPDLSVKAVCMCVYVCVHQRKGQVLLETMRPWDRNRIKFSGHFGPGVTNKRSALATWSHLGGTPSSP